MTTTYLTLIGDRQHGKTTMLINYALNEALAGEGVLYEADSRVMATETFRRAAKIAEGMPGVARISRANGSESISFDNGARILFIAPSGGRGVTADVHILDGSNGEPLMLAKRVVRSALR